MASEPNTRSHRQLHHWVADRLRSDILEGRLRPGEWLRQERLAQAYSVSQMPVREALKQLAAEGLVEHVPYRGVQVVEFAAEDVEDLYACRAFIEGMAARSAAQNVTDEELSDLAGLHEQMVRCRTPEDLAQYRELNRRFHALIFSASRRSYIVRTLAQLWSAFPTMLWSNIPRIAVASVPGRDEPDAAEHEEIVAALAARDPERAERAVRRHIESAGEMLVAGMRAQT
jgi:DNA-binding GntR family transcriptional regulator